MFLVEGAVPLCERTGGNTHQHTYLVCLTRVTQTNLFDPPWPLFSPDRDLPAPEASPSGTSMIPLMFPAGLATPSDDGLRDGDGGPWEEIDEED